MCLVAETRVSHFCGARVDVSSSGEGFIMTPAYPKYYVGEKECIWEVRGAPGQAIGLEVVDLSLRGIGPMENNCTDVLEVRAPGGNPEAAQILLLSVCGERSNLPVVRTTTGPLRITARTASKTLFPKRGVLLRYMPLSCPPPPTAPKDGYLVYSNESTALYMCCVGMAFNDTGSRRRELRCNSDFVWSLNVPDCINASLVPHRQPDVDAQIYRAIMIPESDLMLDLVVPSIIIAVLLIGNAFIIALIMHLKRRRLENKEMGDPEELGEILPNSSEEHGACV
ncbi:hypothetical protein B566_EDAN005505 [Ephemera danica]|nr:hypothetical protein B566_EDAN005505 [Ephemera danica]